MTDDSQILEAKRLILVAAEDKIREQVHKEGLLYKEDLLYDENGYISYLGTALHCQLDDEDYGLDADEYEYELQKGKGWVRTNLLPKNELMAVRAWNALNLQQRILLASQLYGFDYDSKADEYEQEWGLRGRIS